MNERRAHERLREENRVAVTVLSAAEAPELVNRTFFCPTEDISASGLRLCLFCGVPVGAELSMRIAFHKPLRSFKHQGRVVWVREGQFNGHPFALGVQFTLLQEGSLETWTQMMERKLASEIPPPPAVQIAPAPRAR